MRKFILAGLALLLVPALALAGKTVTEGDNTLKIGATFDPAKASKSKQKLRSTKASYDYVAGRTDNARLPDLRSVEVFMGGAKFGFAAFPTCDETDAAQQGDSVCDEDSLVGEGQATAEIHPPNDPTAKPDLPVEVKIYNGSLDTTEEGEPMEPRPGLLLYTEVAGEPVALPFWAEKKNRQVAYRNPDEDSDPETESLYTLKEVHLDFFKRSAKLNGKRIPFLALPTKCDKKWVVTTTNTYYEDDPLTAKHKVKCTKA
ncbi:MAG TPA: hypothetical protein VD790_01045 [Thermoleophilaceae bacterium]|nr:hypothetical protein [Thermoleophilaceae bacterium]